MASYINSCLGSSKNRVEGLLLLNVIVKQCTTDVFQQNASTWIKLLIQTLQGHCAASVYSATCHVLKEIIQYSKSFSDMSREITTTVIPQLLPILITSPEEVTESAVSCINACIKNYPGPVGPFKNKLDSFILQNLDSNTNCKAVYRCYALLSQCGPGGTAGIKHTEAWAYQCQRLMGSLHSTVAELYDGLEPEFMQKGIENSGLDLSPIGLDQIDRVTALVHRWHTLTSCMGYMLNEEMLSVVKVPADGILQLIFRCLSINATILLQRPTQERCLLAGFIPDIHIDALGILHHLILLCRRNLVPHCMNIVSVLCQELVWTQTGNNGYSKQYGVLRQKVYEVFSTWLKALDGCSGILLEETTLVKHLLQDCAPFTDTLQMTSEKGTVGDGPSKKKKRKGYQEISQGISTQRKVHPLANSDLVTAALDTLYWFITTSGSEMTGKKLQEIVEFVIHTLFLVQQSRDSPIPYTSIYCRKGLYSVLQALVLAPNPKVPSPVQCALQLFNTGLLDKCLEVSSYCVEAMRVCESLIHARVPCLNGPIVCDNLIHIGGDFSHSAKGQFNQTDTAQTNGHDENVGKNTSENKVNNTLENMDTLENISVDRTLKRSRQAADLENEASENIDSNKLLKTGTVASKTRVTEGRNSNIDDNIKEVEVIDSDSESNTDEDNDNSGDDDVEMVENKDKNSGKWKGSGKSKDSEVEFTGESGDKVDDTSKETVQNRIDAAETNDTVEDKKKKLNDNKENDDEGDIVNDNKDIPKGQDVKEPDSDVINMMSAFIDAGPDSD
ncbi:proline-, glutamic acid- and leucine-rich protein 1-like [Ruditapes philippinarum]|uniref:proline-, glutamic acid- and leucine-rich protein 1-like n=1 Tax=Ruditapes philippinarum TaxID=129788 RepID=UPI00295ACEB3|nr:proline-, glutamic acid- and leucine-rich protein 1-like [Ruditapes philippinarum]